MGEIEFDGSATTRLEVDEQWSALGVEQVAWVGLAVQQLLGGAGVIDRPPQVPQCRTEKLPIRVGERGCVVGARDESWRLRDPIGEMRRRDVQIPEAGMEPRKGIRVDRWCDPSKRDRFVVRPERDPETVAPV